MRTPRATKGYSKARPLGETLFLQREVGAHLLPAVHAAQRTADYAAGTYTRGGGVVDPLPDDAPEFVADYQGYCGIAKISET